MHAPTNPIVRLAADATDREAWTAAVEAYSGLCWHIAVRMLGDRHVAEDAVQDCLLAIRTSARRFQIGPDGDRSAVAWVARIAVNTCQQRHHRDPRSARRRELSDVAATPMSDVGSDELSPLLREALEALPKSQSEAISLRFFGGLEYADIAQILHIDIGAVRVRVHRGLETLRPILERRGLALSTVALISLVDAPAADVAVLPSTEAKAAWLAKPLPPLATYSTGLVIIMSTIGITLATVLTVVAFSPLPAEQTTTPAPITQPTAPPSQPMNMKAVLKAHYNWLAAQQLADGSWPTRVGDRVEADATNRIAPTASALMSYMTAGFNNVYQSTYRDSYRKGLAWLVAHDDTHGDIVALAQRALALINAHLTATWMNPPKQPLSPEEQALLTAGETAIRALLTERVGPGWPARRGDQHIDAFATTMASDAVHSGIDIYAKGSTLDVKEGNRVISEAQRWIERTQAAQGDHPFPSAATIDGRAVGTGIAPAAALTCLRFKEVTPPKIEEPQQAVPPELLEALQQALAKSDHSETTITLPPTTMSPALKRYLDHAIANTDANLTEQWLSLELLIEYGSLTDPAAVVRRDKLMEQVVSQQAAGRILDATYAAMGVSIYHSRETFMNPKNHVFQNTPVPESASSPPGKTF